MSLVPDYEDSSSNSSESSDANNDSNNEEDSKIEDSSTILQSAKLKLPTPDFIGNTNNSDLLKTSVFTNPFIEAENAKDAMLQKHVKMVDTKDNVVVINGKKICWNYRKGRCRFGHNCKYAHDSDIQKSKEQLDIEKQPINLVLYESQSLPQPSSQELEAIKEQSIVQNQQKRKRPGLTQGLIPGKKVMKSYMNYKS